MKYLLDTHILIWVLTDNKKLTRAASFTIFDENNEIYYSPLSLFEIDLKHSKHPDDMPITGEEILSFCKDAGFEILPLTEMHTLAVKNLTRRANTPPHNDPFDKLILSQAIVEDMIFMTHDDRLGEYDSLNIYKV